MKLNRSQYKYIILVCIAFVSCKKDFLKVVPQGQRLATTTDDYGLLMNYSVLGNQATGGWGQPVIMGDDVSAESTLYNSSPQITQAAFRWEDQIFQSQDTEQSTSIWLSNLYQINKVVNEVMQSTGGTDHQKKAILAEAQASRAWIYFQFINYYGKPYLESTAKTDPGFPIITKADITATEFTRASVQQVYDFIISDFSDAIPNLEINGSNGIRFNKAAAEGLLGKVYLFMGRNADALKQFNAAFKDNASKTTPARLYDYNVEFGAKGKFMPITLTGPNNSPGKNNNDFTESVVSRVFFNTFYLGSGFGNNAFVLSQDAQNLFGASDLRLKFYAAQQPFNIPNPTGRLRKYAMMYTQYGLQLPELYLLSAEAKAKLNDLGGAKADVETLRQNRMPVTDAVIPAAITSNQSSLIAFVFDERVREFAMEGYRWFDMRRQSVDPQFSGKTYAHTLYNVDQKTTTTYTLRPVRLTMRLPLFITNSNPGLVNNP